MAKPASVDEHMLTLDEHLSSVDEHMLTLEERVARIERVLKVGPAVMCRHYFGNNRQIENSRPISRYNWA
jgi:hypothetical protein